VPVDKEAEAAVVVAWRSNLSAASLLYSTPIAEYRLTPLFSVVIGIVADAGVPNTLPMRIPVHVVLLPALTNPVNE